MHAVGCPGGLAVAATANSARPWHEAWAHAQVNEFYRRNSPTDHFDTAIAHADRIAAALMKMLRETTARMPGSAGITVVDLGADSGQLLRQMYRINAADEHPIDHVRWVGIDLRPRPFDLPAHIEWWTGIAPDVLRLKAPEGICGMVIAHEWLDDVPCPIVQRDDADVVREVWVDSVTGVESLGPKLDEDSPQMQWLHQWWWPVRHRGEIGLSRDVAWAAVCASLNVGTAVAIDYAHTRAQRCAGDFDDGTLVAYRDGIVVSPVPDGSANITARVALDSCAAAASPSQLMQQRCVLDEPRWPLPHQAQLDPHRYAADFQRATAALTLRQRSGRGDFWWLRHDVGLRRP